MLIKYTGKLDFYPKDVTKKHEKQSEWKRTAMIKTNCDLDQYYAWFLKKRFNLNINKNLRGSHVTFINDKVNIPKFEAVAKKYHGNKMDFYLELTPISNGEHWWLRAYAPDTEKIRKEMGLDKTPYFGLHFTLGNVNDKYRPHSDYILKSCKLLNIIPYTKRKSIKEHIIIIP